MSQIVTLNDIDELIQKEFIPFRKRLTDQFLAKHPHISGIVNSILSNKDNKFGMQVTENGRVVGEYTFHFEALQINNTECGKLDSTIHHPFIGVIKPYTIIERKILEKIIADEPSFQNEPFSAFTKYLPDITIKFLH